MINFSHIGQADELGAVPSPTLPFEHISKTGVAEEDGFSKVAQRTKLDPSEIYR